MSISPARNPLKPLPSDAPPPPTMQLHYTSSTAVLAPHIEQAKRMLEQGHGQMPSLPSNIGGVRTRQECGKMGGRGRKSPKRRIDEAILDRMKRFCEKGEAAQTFDKMAKKNGPAALELALERTYGKAAQPIARLDVLEIGPELKTAILAALGVQHEQITQQNQCEADNSHSVKSVPVRDITAESLNDINEVGQGEPMAQSVQGHDEG